ncbi:MAG: HIT family protein [Prevotellaceae bacterium]|jgi:histidine triad (HIT) family protein|nr:HIT family protein [Prevotellaceae bacterium]
MSTIFSKIASGEIPSYTVAEDDSYYAFLDNNPIAKGHTLVIPRKEVDYLFDIDEQTLSGLWLFAQKTAKAMQAAIPCKRIGAVVLGLEVPHAHIHLIPLNSEADVDFKKPKLALEVAEFEAIAEAIRDKWKKFNGR